MRRGQLLSNGLCAVLLILAFQTYNSFIFELSAQDGQSRHRSTSLEDQFPESDHSDADHRGIRTAFDRETQTNSSILAIPLMFEVGCNPSSLSEAQVSKLKMRADRMTNMLKEYGLPARPATFCNQEAVDDPQPICEGRKNFGKVETNVKTRNLAKNFLNAFNTCANQKEYAVCLIMEDDTLLHPNFTVEANALMHALPSDWSLVHLCPGYLRGNAGPPQFVKGRVDRLEDWHWFPQPNVDFALKKCHGLGCNGTTRKCALGSKHPRYWLKDDATWGDQINTRVPCIAWIGGPQAYFVKPHEARYLANKVSTALYCREVPGPNDLMLAYQARDSQHRFHYMARDPQLCFEPGNSAKLSSFTNPDSAQDRKRLAHESRERHRRRL
eukprot:m.132707 g.132707  ORF g.132707 m.132707 type:complete len:384 (+) comp17508_c0_seq1:198-1349(+)